ncbi:LptM family lipoprotein [Vagococcus salmoninarum]|uniref:LptM family lipoprotein n=1 Tax=Vagococcus salmoninarum TaxID=2739 RepID=UPI0028D52D65|nr:hypothetical protein [Vagococcus salmoninarum]
MKKKLAILIVLVFTIGLSACGSKEVTNSKKVESSTTQKENIDMKTVSSTSKKEPIKKDTVEKEKEPELESKESSTEDKKTDYTATNLLIAEDLQMSLGWALGQLDRDGNPTDYGTPDEGFVWSVFIEKIELSEEDEQLNVYVTPEFLALDDELKQDYIRTAQNSTIQYTEDGERIFTVVYSGYDTLGTSRITDISSFKFYK